MYIKYPDDTYTLTKNLEKLAEIEKVCSVKGWNLYDADPIDERSVPTVKAILEGLGELPQPFIAPLADGGIQLEWERKDGLGLEIEIDPKEPLYHIFCYQLEGKDIVMDMEGSVKKNQKNINMLVKWLHS